MPALQIGQKGVGHSEGRNLISLYLRYVVNCLAMTDKEKLHGGRSTYDIMNGNRRYLVKKLKIVFGGSCGLESIWLQ